MKKRRRKPMQVTIETIIEQHGLTEAYQEAIKGGENLHLRLENGGWMPLVVEVFTNMVSVAHYGEMNGDAMRDPEIVFDPSFHWFAFEITQDPVGRFQRVPGGHYSKGIEHLARIWAKNLRNQGFTGPNVVTTSLTHKLEVPA